MYGFVTDSPLFDDPGGFYRPLTNEEDIRLRASAQRAMEAGRPMTVAEMYGKPQQLFRQLSGLGEEKFGDKKHLMAVLGYVLSFGGVGVLAGLAIPWWIQEHRPKFFDYVKESPLLNMIAIMTVSAGAYRLVYPVLPMKLGGPVDRKPKEIKVEAEDQK